MHAMILAAGRGERMRPLTDHLPKPLLPVGDKPLIVWHLEKLARANIRDVVINHAWLGELLASQLGDGAQFGLNIRYSAETVALETAGGIAQALPLLGPAPFLVMNGDIWCDWDIQAAHALAESLKLKTQLAWLLLVPNPQHHPEGDFCLDATGKLSTVGGPTSHRYTFSGIGIYDPALFKDVIPGQATKLAPLLRQAMATQQVVGAMHSGTWVDVGTPQRLADLDQQIRSI